MFESAVDDLISVCKDIRRFLWQLWRDSGEDSDDPAYRIWSKLNTIMQRIELGHSRQEEVKLLKLWLGSLRVYKPGVEPEASYLDSLIGWLESYIETMEKG